MGKSKELSRRERQIMDIVFANGQATVKTIRNSLPDAPTDMAIRRMLQILEEKSFLKRRKEGRAVVYSPKQSKRKAGLSALKHVVDTFFSGQLEEALAAHLTSREKVSPEKLERIQRLISEARKQQD